MKYLKPSDYLSKAITLLVLISLSLPTYSQIKIKKPRITISKPKIRVPRPDQIIKNVNVAVTDATKNVASAVEVAIHQTGEVVGKAGKDLVTETGRIPAKVVDLGDATVAYLSSFSKSAENEFNNAQDRLEKGKLLDLLFHAAIAPLKAPEEAAFQATQASGWIKSAGAVAAGAYGGPQGAAAYASWQTYKISKNMEMAIRAGLIAGLTKAATTGIGEIGSKENPEILKKTLLASAVGGAAVAASGGDVEDVRKGLFWGGAMVLVQEGYKSYVGHELDARAATKPPYCINPNDPDCMELRKAYTWNKETKKWDYDPSKLDATKSHVGIQAKLFKPGENIEITPVQTPYGGDQALGMRLAGRVPGMNAMAIFHDKWAVDWNMNTGITMATIPPAIVITYIGAGAPLFNDIQQLSSKQENKVLSPQQITVLNTLPTNKTTTQEEKIDTVEVSSDKIDVWGVLERHQKTLVAGAPKKSFINENSVWGALEKHQQSLRAKTDSVVSKNPGTIKLTDGVVETTANTVWVNPDLETDFRTKTVKGIVIQRDGTLLPDAGWEWAKPENPLSMEVRPIPGIVILSNGELTPADGWDWVDSKDLKNIKVKKLR